MGISGEIIPLKRMIGSFLGNRVIADVMTVVKKDRWMLRVKAGWKFCDTTRGLNFGDDNGVEEGDEEVKLRRKKMAGVM